MPLPLPPLPTAVITATALTTTLATATTTTTLTTTTTQVKGNVWMTGQLLVAAGEDGWWRRINGRFWLCHKKNGCAQFLNCPTLHYFWSLSFCAS
jgi:hypothetical protein